MEHAWERVPLEEYEAHMGLDTVGQLQALNRLMQRQLTAYPVKTLAILGVAGGNGLEHVGDGVERVYGLDVNEAYLEACRRRYPSLGNRLVLCRRDLSDPAAGLPQVELVVADLLVEYLGTAQFARLVKGVRYISCVIQRSGQADFVSPSPYARTFTEISGLHQDISEQALTDALTDHRLLFREEVPCPGKALVRLDYGLSGMVKPARA